jgi:hypothetical protein
MVIEGIKSIPKSALVLGLSGLLPFVFLGSISVYQSPDVHNEISSTLLAYGAIILSFLGGVRWGVAMSEASPTRISSQLCVSIMPSLVGWIAFLVDNQTGLLILTAAFFLMLLLDYKLAGAPNWYFSLRALLSTVVITSLLTVLSV